MQRLIVMYNLKPGVSMEDYKKYSIEVEQKIVPSLPGVFRFEVFEVKDEESSNTNSKIIEDVDVESKEAWQKALDSDVMKPVSEQWAKYGDVVLLVCSLLVFLNV